MLGRSMVGPWDFGAMSPHGRLGVKGFTGDCALSLGCSVQRGISNNSLSFHFIALNPYITSADP